jgi:predicted NUDIX family NTP pyrophosphohydrolase
MAKKAAGLVMFRRPSPNTIEVLLVHPGGPRWAHKDAGAWSIPKGEYVEPEEPLDAAQREFEEETGGKARGPFIELGTIRQKSGKLVTAWACEGEFDPSTLTSNTFEMEWPKGSGKKQMFPEVDRAEWLSIAAAKEKINPAQLPLLDALAESVRSH